MQRYKGSTEVRAEKDRKEKSKKSKKVESEYCKVTAFCAKININGMLISLNPTEPQKRSHKRFLFRRKI